jgi:glycerophosphoryl diester phosphodiesterase
VDSILNIAHRGARSLAPENTLAAARKALEIGADMWELDVGLSADGELILSHDNTLERTSNVAEVFPDRRQEGAHQFTLAELRQLDFGSWFNQTDPFGQIAAGQVSPAEQQSYIGEPIPTLREALAFTRDQAWRVNVELKYWDIPAVDKVIVARTVALLAELGMTERVLLSSFNYGFLAQVRAIDPTIAIGVLMYVTVPEEPLTLLTRLDAQSFHPNEDLLRPERLAELRQHGFGINIYTINEVATMRRLLAAGASGLITDFPQRLRALKVSNDG